MIGGKTWGLVWEWGSFTAVIAGAPSSSLAHSGASAFPGLGALLSTLPVVGLGDGAVLVVWVSGSVLGPVSLPEVLGVIVVLSVGWDNGVSEADSWWGTGGDDGGNHGNSERFHNNLLKNNIIIKFRLHFIIINFNELSYGKATSNSF